jgi:regulator of protease activity HflC (stomatin/prohibitin superfamily)
MNLFGYIIIFTLAVILVLMMRVIFFLLREEQAVEIELGEVEKDATQ